jgi:hypothetical protein
VKKASLKRLSTRWFHCLTFWKGKTTDSKKISGCQGVEGEMNRQSRGKLLGSKTHLANSELSNIRVNPNIHYEQWLIIMHQYWFFSCNQCTTPMQDSNLNISLFFFAILRFELRV